jgi:hypothetical protein
MGVAAQRAPLDVARDLAVLLGRSKLTGQIVAWCGAQLREGEPRSFALALTTAAGGRYVILHTDTRVKELAAYTGRGDLSCYTPAEARTLDRTIQQSDTIHGQIAPRWNTTVVCGFIDDTTAECWQYSPANQLFMKVGGWTT